MKANEHIKIKDISISNYRSFSHEGESIKGLSDINIFVGPNNVGKSVFFNAIRYCFDWNSFNSQGTYELERNFNNQDKPIEIIVNFDTPKNMSTAKLIQEPHSKPIREHNSEEVKQWTFPIGLPRRFSVFVEPSHPITYKDIDKNWDLIREDTEKHLFTKLSCKCPPKRNDDRIFYDLLDEMGASLLEGSDGAANFLFMIFSIRGRKPGSIILIEEPEVSMHPGLQKQFLNYLKELSKSENYQFLITTHSPYLMNLAITNNTDNVSVFRFSKNNDGHTKIRPIKSPRESWESLSDLGHAPADVLQANGIIWVEGPSDLIYITHWIEKLDSELRRGIDYEVTWYGGANFEHLELKEEFWRKTDASLISLFNLNPNWAFIVDSDSDKENNEDHSTQKKFKTINKKKDKLIQECESKGKYVWKVDPYIEECIQGRLNRPKSKRKVDWAREYTMSDNSSDGNLSQCAHIKVEELISEIRKWG